jgi:DNA primase
MTKIQNLLHRLDRVRANGGDRWQACCPAHDDKSPSLSIKENISGKILIHCWAGCDSRDVMAAIGLTLSYLFPDNLKSNGCNALPEWKRRQYQEVLSHETLVMECFKADKQSGKTIQPDDLLRVNLAIARSKIINEVLSDE